MSGTGPAAGALSGRRVLVTRHWPELMTGLASLGAIASEVPLIELRPPSDPRPLDAALVDLGRYDWMVFTSANAVEAVSTRMAALAVAFPAGVRLASVGPATTEAVRAAWRDTSGSCSRARTRWRRSPRAWRAWAWIFRPG